MNCYKCNASDWALARLRHIYAYMCMGLISGTKACRVATISVGLFFENRLAKVSLTQFDWVYDKFCHHDLDPEDSQLRLILRTKTIKLMQP